MNQKINFIIVIVIGVIFLAGGLFYYLKTNSLLENAPQPISLVNKASNLNTNQSATAGLPLEVSDLENVEVASDLQEVDTLESDLGTPELDLLISF